MFMGGCYELLQQPLRSSCASLVGPMGLLKVTALMEPRVTSLLATFLWIAAKDRDTSAGHSEKAEHECVFCWSCWTPPLTGEDFIESHFNVGWVQGWCFHKHETILRWSGPKVKWRPKAKVRVNKNWYFQRASITALSLNIIPTGIRICR